MILSCRRVSPLLVQILRGPRYRLNATFSDAGARISQPRRVVPTTGRFSTLTREIGRGGPRGVVWRSLCALASTSERSDVDSALIDASLPRRRDFLQQVETTVARVLQHYIEREGVDLLSIDVDDSILLSLPSSERQAVGVARHLHERVRAARTNGDCRRCWLQQANCICSHIQPLALPACVNRIFLLTHHKEICMAVDTAKLILAAFPDSSRLVVGGIPAKFQESMEEMMDSLTKKTTLVLFPAEDAQTISDYFPIANRESRTVEGSGDGTMDVIFDLIVPDGTWEQARRLYNRYISSEPVARRVQLSIQSLSTFASPDSLGRQLRRHPVPVREIATAHALQLLLQDIVAATGISGDRFDHQRFSDYQDVASAAALAQLGPPRLKKNA